jgi:hypothetical protein
MKSDNKYISKYSNGKTVSAAQYITEIICENKAKKDKLDLHYRFWTHKTWNTYYRNQIASAHKLLNRYDAKAIINALKDKDAEKIYSLRAPHLPAIIEKHQGILESANQTLTINIDRSQDKSYRKTVTQKNVISKLKELE